VPQKYKRKTNRAYVNGKAHAVSSRFEPGFVAKLDGRTEVARMLRANYELIVADLGGEDELSYFQRSLIERALWMSAFAGMTVRDVDDTVRLDRNYLCDPRIQPSDNVDRVAEQSGL